MNVSALASLLAVLLYTSASLILGLRMARVNAQILTNKGLAIALGGGGVLLHTVALYHGIAIGSELNLGFFNSLSLVGWLIALLLLLASISQPVENLGVALLPITALAVALDALFPSGHAVRETASLQLDIHILISILAYSLLSIAAVQAALLAIQDHHLRHKHPGGFIRSLPPLAVMETLLFQMIAAGFVLLSLSLLTGVIFLEDIFAQHLVHKTVLSILAWLVFAVLLWGRWRFGWRGQTAIRWTLGGVITLMLAYFGSKLVLEFILHR